MSLYHKESDNDPLYKAQRKTYLDRFTNCRICGGFVPRNERAIDHIIAMCWYDGLYWEKKNWQMICPQCSKIKTKIEGQP